MTSKQREEAIRLLQSYADVTESCLTHEDYCPGCECHGDENGECECLIEVKLFLKEVNGDTTQP